MYVASQGLPKILVPVPVSSEIECDDWFIDGVWIYPWQDVCWHIESKQGKSRVTGYTIVIKNIKREEYNV